MRFHINFNYQDRSLSAQALERFLNYHLIELHHGTAFEAIFINFKESKKKGQYLKPKLIYKKFAELPIPMGLLSAPELHLIAFIQAFEAIAANLNRLLEIDLQQGDFEFSKLKKDLTLLQQRLPKTQQELAYYIDNGIQLDKEIRLKRVNGRIKHRAENKRELLKKLLGFRAYEKKENLQLRQYLNKITSFLTENLKQIPLLTSGYSEIYFSISDQMEDAKSELPLEDWYEYTYVELDYGKFEILDHQKRFEYLTEILVLALHEICRIDHLEPKSIELHKNKLQEDIKGYLSKHTKEQVTKDLNAGGSSEKILLNRKLN